MPFNPEQTRAKLAGALERAKRSRADEADAPVTHELEEQKEQAKRALRDAFEIFVRNLEHVYNRLAELDRAGSGYFDSLEKIEDALELVSEYNFMYTRENSILQSKEDEAAHVLTDDEVDAVEAALKARIDNFDNQRQFSDERVRDLLQKKEVLLEAAKELEPDKVEPTARNLKAELDEARKRYLAAKREMDNVSFIKKSLGTIFSGKVKKEVEEIAEEFKEAEDEYKDLRGEYVEGNITNFIAEKEELLKARIEDRENKTGFGQKASRGAAKAYEGFKSLSRKYNLEKALEKTEKGHKILQTLDKATWKFNLKGKERQINFGRGAVKLVNIRTATSLGLLATGVGFGAGSAIGISAIIGRRVLSGTGTSVGLYDLGDLVANKISRKKIEGELKNWQTNGTGRISSSLASLEAEGLLSGKTLEEIQNDDLYNQLVDARNQNLERNPDVDLNGYLDSLDNRLDDELRNRKILKIGGKILATYAGVIVGSGALAKLLGHKTELASGKGHATHEALGNAAKKTALTSKRLAQEKSTAPAAAGTATETAPSSPQVVGRGGVPSAPIEHAVPVEHPGSATADAAAPEASVSTERIDLRAGAYEEVQPDGSSVLHAGSRGIEGAMLDLKLKDPDKFQAMLKWMNQQEGVHLNSQDLNADAGKIVHRFIDKFGHDNIDPNSGQDLNRLFSASMKIGNDGHVELDTGHISFMPPHQIHEVADATGGHANVPSSPHEFIPASEAANLPEAPGNDTLELVYSKLHSVSLEQAHSQLAAIHTNATAAEWANYQNNLEHWEADFDTPGASHQELQEALHQQENFLSHAHNASAATDASGGGKGIVGVEQNQHTSGSNSETLDKNKPSVLDRHPNPPLLSKDITEQALDIPQASRALEFILPPGKFAEFLNKFNMSRESLDSIQDMPLSDFFNGVKAGGSFRNHFLGLGNFFENLKNYSPEASQLFADKEYLNTLTIKEFLVNYMSVRVESGRPPF